MTIEDTIIQNAARGDMRAFEKIYTITSGLVYATALRIILNRTDAEEIMQDVYVKVHKSIKKFKVGTSFPSWIYRITVNTAINAYNKKMKELRPRDDFDKAVHTEHHSPEIDKKINSADKEATLSRLLAQLNPDQRTCIVLREIQGLNYKEIAQTLNVNINTVRTRLKRARHALIAFAQKRVVHNEV